MHKRDGKEKRPSLLQYVRFANRTKVEEEAFLIVFTVKFRRKEVYGKIKADIGIFLRELHEHKRAVGGPFLGALRRNANRESS